MASVGIQNKHDLIRRGVESQNLQSRICLQCSINQMSHSRRQINGHHSEWDKDKQMVGYWHKVGCILCPSPLHCLSAHPNPHEYVMGIQYG